MLGGTLSNLDNELRFVRDSLCGFGPGSLLLLDYPCVFGATESEVQRQDPWLCDKGGVRWRGRAEEFLTGPLRRYCPGAESIELSAQLGTACTPIGGSYAVEILARVRGGSPAQRVFSIFRIKRYTTDGVIQALRGLGWVHVTGTKYGQDSGYPRTLSLFERRQQPV